MELLQTKNTFKSNKDVVIVLDRSYVLDEPIIVPSSYSSSVTIIANGYSIESKTDFSFIIEGGSFRHYGGSINSPVLITGSHEDTPHAFVGVDFSKIQKDTPPIQVNNISRSPTMRVLVMASIASKELKDSPFVSYNDQEEGTVWVVGCDLNSNSKKVIGGIGPRSSAVSVGNTLGSCVEILSSEIRDKISFNNYYYENNKRYRFSTDNEYDDGILHNEPLVVNRRPHLDVSAIPTLSPPRGINLVAGSVRYIAGVGLDYEFDNFEGHTTIFDQCSLRTHEILDKGSIILNSYLSTYYNCNEESILFINPFDSELRNTRINFVSRKAGTW